MKRKWILSLSLALLSVAASAQFNKVHTNGGPLTPPPPPTTVPDPPTCDQSCTPNPNGGANGHPNAIVDPAAVLSNDYVVNPQLKTTTYTISPGACGAGILDCFLYSPQGGYIWVDVLNRANFVDFYSLGGTLSTTSTAVSVRTVGLPAPPAPSSIAIEYDVTGTTSAGSPYVATVLLYLHTYCGGHSGRGAGGGCGYVQVDSGIVTVTQ